MVFRYVVWVTLFFVVALSDIVVEQFAPANSFDFVEVEFVGKILVDYSIVCQIAAADFH